MPPKRRNSIAKLDVVDENAELLQKLSATEQQSSQKIKTVNIKSIPESEGVIGDFVKRLLIALEASNSRGSIRQSDAIQEVDEEILNSVEYEQLLITIVRCIVRFQKRNGLSTQRSGIEVLRAHVFEIMRYKRETFRLQSEVWLAT